MAQLRSLKIIDTTVKLNSKILKGMFVYKHILWKDEIVTSTKSMIFKYLRNGFPRKLEIHVWCKIKFLDELVRL